MKRFVITIFLFITIPLILLVGVYLWTDPFKCIHDFDVNNVDATNREYLSTELFLKNNPTYHYNSFIFSSSRGGGMNTYQWKQYLPEGAQPFLFQAWGESLTGIELKMTYLNNQHVPIDNALILLDIPSAFIAENQLPRKALSMKHYLFTGKSKFGYNAVQFFNFIQKPSFWKKCIKNKLQDVRMPYQSDMITNDWEASNKYNYLEMPAQDSLKHCSDMTRKSFFALIEHGKGEVIVSKQLITAQYEKQLRNIRTILDANHTNYHVILTPGYCYTEPAVNPKDLVILQQIFGAEWVHDYTGKNAMTEDYNNFSDPGHFGLRVGYMIIEDIYKDSEKRRVKK